MSIVLRSVKGSPLTHAEVDNNFSELSTLKAPLASPTFTDPNWTAYQVTQTWVDAGAAVGPLHTLFRDSASPAASDALGELQFSGRDSGNNQTLYAYAYGIISSPTNGSESGIFSIGTVQAGAYADKLFVGGGMWLAGTGGDPGSGKINALEYQVGGVKLEGWRTGSIVQTVYGQNGSNASTSGTIATIATVPASTDGASCVSASITPTNASSLVRARVSLQAFCSAAGTAWVALFRGTTCVAAQLFYGSGADNVYPHVHLQYTDAPGTTSSTSYTVRFGTIAGTGITVYVNGNASGAALGGKNVASIVLEELHA